MRLILAAMLVIAPGSCVELTPVENLHLTIPLTNAPQPLPPNTDGPQPQTAQPVSPEPPLPVSP